MKTTVVIPTYNEALGIKDLIRALQEGLPDLNLLIVDDESPDGTARLVQEMGVEVLVRSGQRGLGSAYQAGFARALSDGADFIVQMDADFSHKPSELRSLLDNCSTHDLVIGSRYIPEGKITGWGPWRHFCSRSAMKVSRRVLSLPIQDVTSGFRVWKANLLRRVLNEGITSNGYAFQEEMLFHACRLGAEVKESPIHFHDREVGQSKLSAKDVAEFFVMLYQLRKKYGPIKSI